MKRIILAFAFLLLASSPALADDFDDGTAAVQRGDYQTARALWMPLAKNGHAAAQYNLGALYANGLGVEQDYSKALRWFNASAEQGNPMGMFYLGMLYADGNGTPQNLGAAYVWFRLAVQYGVNDPTFSGQMAAAQNYLGQVAGAISNEQRLEFEGVVMQWKPKTPKK